MEIKQVKPWRLFHVIYPTQYDLCMTFVRIQEYYESPNRKFRGKAFTLDQYMDWYCRKSGLFTYTRDWNGFNVPGDVVCSFYWKQLDLRAREIELEESLRERGVEVYSIGKEEPYYLIGTHKRDNISTFEHEIRHAWFYLVPEYKEAATKAVKRYKLKGIKKVLATLGYNKDVFVDEIQAFVSTGLSATMKETEEISKLREELEEIKKQIIE